MVPRRATPPGPLDLHLFAEGRHRRLWELLGAHPGDDGTTFAVWAPNASKVTAVGDWCSWDPAAGTVLTPQGTTGIWWGLEPAAGVGDRYKYEVVAADGTASLRADPVATAAETPPGTASVTDVMFTVPPVALMSSMSRVGMSPDTVNGPPVEPVTSAQRPSSRPPDFSSFILASAILHRLCAELVLDPLGPLFYIPYYYQTISGFPRPVRHRRGAGLPRRPPAA